MDLPNKVIFPVGKDRPKTSWLKLGMKRLGVRIEISRKWVDKYRPPSNPRGLIIYPIEFVFGEKRKLVMFDINTIPDRNVNRLMRDGNMYFKIHVRRGDVKKWGIIPAPNSASSVDYLDGLEYFRRLRSQKNNGFDFMFVGWHDDDGMRMETVKRIRKMGIREFTGLLPFKHHTKVPKSLLPPGGERLHPGKHWTFQAVSRLNLALPGGRHLPYVSFRHVELWGFGCTVISKKPDCVLVGDPDPSKIMVIYNLNNLEEVVRYYLDHDEEREEIGRKGMEYYDEWLQPEKHAVYMINKVKERIFR